MSSTGSAAALVATLEQELRPLVVAAESAWWDAAVAANADAFTEVRATRGQPGLDASVARQGEPLAPAHLAAQLAAQHA
jgi:hypothetical protein